MESVMSNIGVRVADHPVLAPAKPAVSLRLVAAPAVAAASVAAAQMHPHVYHIVLGVWATFLGIFWVTFWSSSYALFMVTISTFYAAMFFGVPYVMLRQTPESMKAQSPFQTFLKQPFATIDGSITGFEALLQVIMVPACLTLGGAAISLIIRSARSMY
jgi:hypothetical protein